LPRRELFEFATSLAMMGGMIKPAFMANSDSSPSRTIAQSKISARLFAGFLIAVIAVIGLVVFGQSLFDPVKMRNQFLSKMSNWTGGAVTSSGPVKFSFFPGLKVTLNDIKSAKADAPIGLQAKSIDVGISLWPLFVGKIEASSLHLNDAELTVHANAMDTLKQSWSSNSIGTSVDAASKQVAADIAAPNLSAIANEKLGSVELVRATISIQSVNGSRETFQNLNGLISWPNVHSRAALTAAADWRNEPVHIAAQIADPLLFLAGGNSDLNLNVTSEPMTLLFDGNSNLVSNFFADGDITWKTPSMRRFLQWVRASSTAGEAIGVIELNAKMITKDGKLLFNDMTMLVSGSAATGALEVDPFVKPIKSSGTLAFKSVDLVALAASLPIGVDKADAGEMHLLDDLDLDLRLSAEEATLAGYSISNAAGAIRIAKGDASIDLGTGEIAGGTVMGRLELSGPSDAKIGRLVAGMHNVHQDQLTDLPIGIPVLAGPISGKFEMAGAYANLHSFIGSGTGTIAMQLDSGVIRNFNLETMQAALDTKPVFELPSVYAGMSEARALNLSANVTNGVVRINSANATIDGRIITLSGAFPLLSQGLALHGLITDEVQTETSKPSPFFLGGTWQRPLVTQSAK
jgi:AsmA protein